MKKKNVTIEDLAVTVKSGFEDMHSLFKLTRAEMATADEQREIKTTVDSLWKMLDDEARFIQQMRTEYPLIVKRLERIEKQLGITQSIMD